MTNLGLSTVNNINWKNGVDPTAKIIKQIANYFNVSIDYLLGNEHLPNSSNKICHDEIDCALLYEIKDMDKDTKKEILLYARYKIKVATTERPVVAPTGDHIDLNKSFYFLKLRHNRKVNQI